MEKYKEMQEMIDKEIKELSHELQILDKKLAKAMRERSEKTEVSFVQID